jgi:hypothetical protein
MGKSTISMAIFNSYYFDITRGYFAKGSGVSRCFKPSKSRGCTGGSIRVGDSVMGYDLRTLHLGRAAEGWWRAWGKVIRVIQPEMDGLLRFFFPPPPVDR